MKQAKKENIIVEYKFRGKRKKVKIFEEFNSLSRYSIGRLLGITHTNIITFYRAK